jgi:anti-sigma factor RsiW
MTSMGSCEQARGQLALASIGRLPEVEKLALESHLEGCPACRTEVENLSGLGDALSLAQLDHLEHVIEVPDSLRQSVFQTLGDEIANRRRLVHMRFAAAAAIVLLAIAGGVFAAVATTGGPSAHPAGPTFALAGPGGAHGTVSLTSESWGTSVKLHASGEPANQILTVSMRTSDGYWWTAGSYRSGDGGPVDVPMSCPIPSSRIDGVRVTDSSGKQVMQLYDS